MRKKWLSPNLLLLVAAFIFTAESSAESKADPAAIVISGDVRFTVLTPRLIRMEWSGDKTFEDRASLVFINRRLPVPKFQVSDQGEWLIINTSALSLHYKKESGKFAPENILIKLNNNNKPAEWRPGMSDALNLKGTTRTLDGTNGEKDVKLEEGILSRSGWAVIDDTSRPLFDGSEWNWVAPRQAGERQDWYFFGYGHDYKSALLDFSRAAGRIPMPPRFAFGYWWSRYWTYSDDELRALVEDMKRNDVPIDVLVIDMDWHETWGLSNFNTRRDPFGQAVGWTGYTWNRSLFPDPPHFLTWAHEQRLKTALNLHPASGISPLEEKYSDFTRACGFADKSKEYIPFKVEEKKWTQAWFEVILHPLEKQGIDFFWLDWQAWLENKGIKNLSNTWWLNYVFFSDMERGGQKRPLLFHRWGGLGNHRYQIGFSGDTYITWDSLAYQPYFTATAANVGYGYWSHDIGGHMGTDDLDPELYLRWLQFGAFSPILRTHATKNASIERRIWKYSQHEGMMRDAIHLRYALFPYIYSAARQAYDSGVSICRPMYYDYPEAPEAYDFKGQYLFGEDMIVAPVTKKAELLSGLATQKIWLPQGSWYEWSTGSLIAGGKVVERSFALSEIPVYVKSGAIIPMRPRGGNLQEEKDQIVLTVIPGAENTISGWTTIYEDDGESNAYRTGGYAETSVKQDTLTLPGEFYTARSKSGSSYSMAAKKTTIRISARSGSYAGMPQRRSCEIRLPGTYKPLSVEVNGSALQAATASKNDGWIWDATSLTTHVFTPLLDCRRAAQIEIAWPYGQDNSRLNGKIGLLGRLPRIVQMIKDEVNRRDTIANAPSWVLKAGSLPARLRYQPEKAEALLAEFDAGLPQLVQQIMDYQRGDPETLTAIVRQLPLNKPIAAKPSIKLEKEVSDKPTLATISHGDNLALVTYTLDGSLPDEKSLQYRGPFIVDESLTVRARCFWPGFMPSFPASARFQLVHAKSVTYAYPCSPRCDGGGDFALVNGLIGSAEDFRTNWVGFQGVDMIATIELANRRDLSRITARFLQDQQSWIFLPSGVTFEVSSDGVNFRSLFDQDMETEAAVQSDHARVKEIKADLRARGISHVRVTAKNMGICPAWHSGAGGKAWIFCDEITIE